MEWQTLGELAKKAAALPIEVFKAQWPWPFLLELNPESGAIATGETRAFDPERAKGEAAPSLGSSLIVYFGPGEQVILGRGEGCHVRSGHHTISDKHAVFERFGTMWALRDCGSKNGTFLNGRRMGPEEQSPLKFGTKLMLGEAQFLFLGPDDCFELFQELIKEPRIRPRSLGKFKADFAACGSVEQLREQFPGPFLIVQAPTGREADPSAGPVSTNTVTLSREELGKQSNPNVADAVFNLGAHSIVRVGRATVTQIHLPLPAISNLHAAFIRDEGGWFVQDLGAKNGTYVWGERLEGRRKIESGAEVMLGNIKSIFFSTDDLITYAANRDIVGG